MKEFFAEAFAEGMLSMYGEAILVTLKITLISTAIAYLIGIPWVCCSTVHPRAAFSPTAP